ncbi:MAG: nucleotidyltransferase domain-containing protein [Candidatus Woesebacteria bacterium]|jgi:DNA polymerase (family 10)
MKLPLNKKMSNDEIAKLFKFIGEILALKSANRFRARAYEEAGVVIHQLDYQLADEFAKLKKQDPAAAKNKFIEQLDELPGIGESIASKIVELFTTGHIRAFEKYTAKFPGGMYPLVQLYGIGAKKALKLCQKFKLNKSSTAINDLLAKTKAGELSNLAGFGEKSEVQLIEALEKQHKKARIPRERALKMAKKIKQAMLKVPEVKRVIFLGSLRREAETVGDLDLGAVIIQVSPFKKAISKIKLVKRLLVAGDNMIRMVLTNNWQVDLKISPADEWGSFVQHFTGSKEHNIRLREFAMTKGLSLSEHGIKDKKTGKIKKFATEKEFYNYLGLKLIPPQERVGKNEIERYQLER